ncbi:MAG: DNA-binding transcriptional regulator [Sedimentisphaerales bacterium]|nr:DNA-binding transcriptional regulator [Sedimentisphaerales bacterium]
MPRRNKQKSDIKVAFVVPGISLNLRHILRGVCRYTKGNTNWHLRIAGGVPSRVLPSLKKTGIDGMFVAMHSKKIVSDVTEMKLPCIGMDCLQIPDVFPYLTADSFQAGKLAAEHFLERGFRHFAYYSASSYFWSNWRMEGFSQSVRQAGYTTSVYKPSVKAKKRDQYDWQSGRTWMKGLKEPVEWLHSLPKPAGLMVCDDTIGYDLLEAAEEAGIHIPEEVAVVGVFNDDVLCNAAKPLLSSVSINLELAGYRAAHLLNSIIIGEEKMASQAILAPATHVVVRQSSDIMAIEDKNVASAVNFIRKNFNSHIQVADIVDSAACSRRSLESKFQKFLGRSILKEVIRVRVEHIASLLLESDLSIDQIARASTFDSVSHLIRVFKKHKGLPPNAFRKTHSVI